MKEYVRGICEFAKNQLLVHIEPTGLFIVDHWKVTHEITDPVAGNIQKHWLSVLPKFDLETFPFIVCSGYKTFNLINVRTKVM